MSTNTADNTNSYDEVPYESSPYANSHPNHLATIGTLFGMKPTAIEKARILELGCASGGNIIPIATQFPKAEIVGVDLSEVQIKMADKVVKDLKLKNIKFYAKSITDIKDELGKFDYIIVHGILSWVPEFVQKSIFEVCGRLLTEQGIAYISYNTAPGWNTIQTIRDMMLYHTKDISSVQDKITQARLLLKFIAESTEQQNSPYSEILKNEAELLAKQPDYYLRHDHLEDNNKPFYFKDIAAMAQENKLQYLGDASLPSMFIGNLPKEAAEKLNEVNDITRSEQYMDFITNRRFRMTLLCKQGVPLTRNLSPEMIKSFALSMTCSVDGKLKKADLTNTKEITFNIGTGSGTIGTANPVIKLALYNLGESISYIEFKKLEKLVYSELEKAGLKQEAENAGALIATECSRLMLKGVLSVKTKACPFAISASDTPKALPLVQYQCQSLPIMWATNANHDRIALNVFDKYALRYCDGKNTHEQIIDKLFTHVENDELTITVNKEKTKDKKAVTPQLKEAMENSLKNWVKSALLSA